MRWYYTQTERIIHPEQEKWMKRQPHEVDFDYDIMGIALFGFAALRARSA